MASRRAPRGAFRRSSWAKTQIRGWPLCHTLPPRQRSSTERFSALLIPLNTMRYSLTRCYLVVTIARPRSNIYARQRSVRLWGIVAVSRRWVSVVLSRVIQWTSSSWMTSTRMQSRHGRRPFVTAFRTGMTPLQRRDCITTASSSWCSPDGMRMTLPVASSRSRASMMRMRTPTDGSS